MHLCMKRSSPHASMPVSFSFPFQFKAWVQVHAPLHEKVLSPRLHASVFLLPLPIQGLGAIIQVCQEGAEALVTDHLQVAEESVVHVLAVLQVNTA